MQAKAIVNRFALLVLTFIAAATAVTAADLEFAGMLELSGSRLFLVNCRANSATYWIALGQTVRGVTVSAFDATTENLSVRVGGQQLVLPLMRSKVRASTQTVFSYPGGPGFGACTITASGGIEATTFKKIGDNLRQLRAGLDYYYRQHPERIAEFGEIVGPAKMLKALTPVDGEDYSGIDLHNTNRVYSVTTRAGVKVTLEYVPPEPQR